MNRSAVVSEISRDISQVFFASIFVDPIMRGGIDARLVIAGLILAMMGWCVSIVIIKT